MKTCFPRAVCLWVATLLAYVLPLQVTQAATVTKANTGNDLGAGASWIGGTAPTAADIAAWDSLSLGAGLTLGANANWLGISASGALSDIDLTGAGTLTLGGNGINLSGSTVNLSLANNVAMATNQAWLAGGGKSLTHSGGISGGFPLSVNGLAHWSFLPASATTVFENVSLASVTSGGGMMGGTSVNSGTPLMARVYYFNNNGTTASYQLQVLDGGHTKCVKVLLAQSGANLTAHVVYAKYLLNTANLGFNFDNGGTVNSIATSPAANGYGAAFTILGVGSTAAYTSYLPATPTTVAAFPNTSLASVTGAGGTMGGGYVDGSPAAAMAYFFTNNGATATYQLQSVNGAYTKCVKVQLTQSGSDILATVLYARYVSGANLGNNFDVTYNEGTIATSAGAGGYGAASIFIINGASTGTVTLSGTNTYTGNTIINAGTLAIGGAGLLGNGAYASNILNNAAFVYSSSATQILSGVISGSGTLTKTGPGALTLANINTFNGNVTVNGGVLRSTAGNINGATGLGQSNVITVNAGGILDVGGANGTAGQLGASPLNTITVNGGTVNFSLSGASGRDGPYMGTFNLTNATVTATTTSGPRWGYDKPSGILNVGGTVPTVWSAPIWLVVGSGKSLTVNADADLVISGAITDFTGLGGLPLIKNGPAKLILSGANTFIGSNIVNHGTLQLVDPAGFASAGIFVNSTAALELSNTVAVTLNSGISGAGGLTKQGAGAMVLGAAHTYSGATVVSAGKLYANGALNPVSAVSVAANATFGGRGSAGTVTVAEGGSVEGGQGGSGALTLTNLTFSGAGGLNVTLAEGVTPLVVNGTLTTGPSAAGPITINILNGSQPAAGTYHVAEWANLAGAAGFVLPPNRIYTLQTNGNYLDVVVSASNPLPIWTGLASSEWSLNSIADPKNWKLNLDDSPTDFLSSDNVLFDDSAPGATTVDISVADVSPALVTFSNTSLNYTLTGTRGMASGSLLKLGSGLLAVSNVNSYVAGTVLSNGTIAFVSGGLGSAGAIRFGGNSTLRWLGHSQDLSGRLAIDAGVTATLDLMTNSVTLANAFGGGGTGALLKTGAGALTLSAANTYTGPTTISQGAIYAGNGGALGGGPVILGDAGTGSNNVFLFASSPLTINNPILVANQGTGAATIGTANFTAIANTQFGGLLTLNRGVTLQAGSSDRTTFGNIITGVGDLTITSPFANNRRIVLQRASGNSNDFAGNIYISANADLQIGVADSIGDRVVPNTAAAYLAPGARLRLAPTGSGDWETMGTLHSQAPGAGTVDMFTGAGFTLVIGADHGSGSFSGTLTNSSGVLSLTKTGSGIQELAGTNIVYSGATLVSNGVLRLNNCPRFASGVTVAADATLSGWATIRGPVVVQAGGTLQPGLGGADTSALTISNSLSLSGNSLFVLNRTNEQNSSRVLGITTLTAGGALIVSNAGPALQAGDSFVLFSASSRAGDFAETNLPPLDAGLVWVTPDNYSTLLVMDMAPPVFTLNPVSRTILTGYAATFAAAAMGAPPITYQWLSNGIPIVDATNTTLQLTGVQPSFSGAYAAVASNPYGSSTSLVAQLTVPTGSSLPTVIGADSPSGYWRLGESSGPVAFDMTGAHDGGYSNNVTLDVPGALVSDADTAARFDGVSGKVDVPYSAAINPPVFTVECWARVTGGAGHRSPLTARDDQPQRGFIFYATPANTWQFWSGSGAQTGWDGDGAGGPAVVNNQWVHLAGTYDGATKCFYVNGQLVRSTNVVIAPNTARPLRIGAGSTDLITGNYYFPGDVDEVAIFPAALPAERIAAHFAAAKGRFSNQAPIARDDNAAIPQDNPIVFPASKVLGNDTDADGDTLTVLRMDSTSTNGGTVVYTNDTVAYTPQAGFIGVDRFSYTVTDGYAANSTGQVVITVVSTNAVTMNVVFGPVLSGGNFQVRFAGIPGRSYTVEYTDTLTSPQWRKAANLTAPLSSQGFGVGIMEFIEPAGAATNRFYRTVHPAY